MTTLHIEHGISDFLSWKASFDRFAEMRKEQRVRSFEISQPVDNPSYVIVRLELDSVDDAKALLVRVRQIWAGGVPVVRGEPRVTITENKVHETL